MTIASEMNSIEWHENNLKNQRGYIDNLYKEANGLIERAKKSETEATFLEEQISEAKNQGKKSFDKERFLIKRGKKQ